MGVHHSEVSASIANPWDSDGFLKQVESFFFFNISNPSDFRKRLPQVIPLISNVGAQQAERARVKSEVDKIKAGSDATSQDARDKVVNSKQANIAFTVFGLQKVSHVTLTFTMIANSHVALAGRRQL